MALPRVPGSAPGSAVNGDLAGHVGLALAQQVRQHPVTQRAGLLESFGVAGGSDPHRNLALDRAGPRLHAHSLTQRAGKVHALTAPQTLHLVDALEHARFAVGKSARRQRKVIGLPAGGKRHADAALREVVHQGPVFGSAYRVVQRQHATAGAQVHARGHCGQRGAGHGGVGVQAAKVMKVTLRRPDRFKALAVGKARAFQQQLVTLVRLLRPVIAKEKQTEARAAAARRCSAGVQHQRQAAAERPTQLQHRNVKRQTGDRQQARTRRVRHTLVHAGKEIHHVAMRHHDAFGLAGGARGVDDIGSALCRGYWRRG